MDNLRELNHAASGSPIGRLIPILLVFAGLIGLYYLYQYLFGLRTATPYTLIAKKQKADIDPSAPIVIRGDQLPPLFEGGEFTFSTWIYVNNWSYRSGYAKSIVLIGGRSFDVLRIYLGGSKPRLHVRLHTKGSGEVPRGNSSGAPIATQDASDLSVATRNSVFGLMQTDQTLWDSSVGCDMPEIELQRWVNIVVCVNGKTVDVYLDGKLARACVLPVPFRVDPSYSATLLKYGGFGGDISTTIMYDSALHPEAVYRNYISGPEPISSFGDWLTSFFTVGVNVSVDSTSTR